jgi:hypothetical protein
MIKARRIAAAVVAAGVALGLAAAPAAACGGLVAPNGAVRLLRTSTLAAYHDGVEHYVTSFEFAGGGTGSAPSGGQSEFGSIVPLPGVPSAVERGGDWTLQRLTREVTPLRFAAAAATTAKSSAIADTAEVLLQTRIDALDLTVLRGGGKAVGDWARDHGFLLTPDAPEVLDFYARRSPVFLAARFNATAAAARGLSAGDGTPIHLTIPIDNPWVPLRILTLGRGRLEPVNADVFLLTDKRPSLLPAPSNSMRLARSEPASPLLLSDLRTDKGMAWVPQSMWLSYLKIDTSSDQLQYDLAVDTSGRNRPSARLTGRSLTSGSAPVSDGNRSAPAAALWVLAGGLALGTGAAVVFVAGRTRQPRSL